MKNEKKTGNNLRIERLLGAPDKEAAETHNALAKLYRVILGDLNIGFMQLVNQINRWVDRNIQNGTIDSPEKRSSVRSNLMKETVKDTMSIDVLLKLLDVHNVESVELVLRAKRKGKLNPSEHSIQILDLPGYVNTYIMSKPPRKRKKRSLDKSNYRLYKFDKAKNEFTKDAIEELKSS